MQSFVRSACALFLAMVASAAFAEVQVPSAIAAPAVTASARLVPPSFADLVQTLSPAVVNISTSQKVKRQVTPFGLQLPNDPQFDQFRGLFEQFGMVPGGRQGGMPKTIEQEVYSLGSGFIIDAGGIVVTNNHVINDADKIKVILTDNTKLDAKIIGRDPKTDLALLKVESRKPLPAVKFGNSDTARVGDWVLAIGNPFGLGGTVTSGIISARARNIHAGAFDDFIQTDAAINRGNSGGPLFNMNGEVVGINSAIFSPTGGNIGIGFAIPANLVQPVINQLKAKGKVERGWLGVKIQEVDDEIANSLGLKETAGALVVEVTPQSPAARMGIIAGDVIMKFNGRDVGQTHSLPRIVAETPIGKTVPVVVWRSRKMVSLNVTILEMKEEKPSAGSKLSAKPGSSHVLGMELSPLTAQLRSELNIPADSNGAVVVKENDATERGVTVGDVILQINDRTVTSPQEVKEEITVSQKAGRDYVLLRILRNSTVLFVTLPIK